MMSIEQLKLFASYNPETGEFVRLIGKLTGQPIRSKGRYITLTIKKKTYLAHRLAWAFVYGYWPEYHIDHINVVGSDNRLVNLRAATVRENSRNVKIYKNNTSGVKGVSWNKQNENWRARLKTEAKYLDLGSFDDKRDAIRTYALAAKSKFVKFARFE